MTPRTRRRASHLERLACVQGFLLAFSAGNSAFSLAAGSPEALLHGLVLGWSAGVLADLLPRIDAERQAREEEGPERRPGEPG